MTLQWDERDDQAVITAKLLAADAVEQAGSGHPGAAISLAPAAYLLYQRHLRFDPDNPKWIGRDRFVLSAGHASMLQYAQLFMAGAGLELEDIKAFRTFGSKTPGHPELGSSPGIELTTGPLGTGFAAAVGMAMASRRKHAIFDPETALGHSPFDHYVYTVVGDGCMQEGITAEASSLAGTQELGNLIVIYDDNHISIEDDTSITFTEDVIARFDAYGWHTQTVSWLESDGDYVEDVAALDTALRAARAETTRPSLIALRTIIGWPTPEKQNTGAIHGAKLGSQALTGLKETLGAATGEMFGVDENVLAYTRGNAEARGREVMDAWLPKFEAWASANPNLFSELERIEAGLLPADWTAALPTFEEGQPIATRAASGKVLNALAPVLPELWGGSADLAGSNNTFMAGYPSFLPEDRSSSVFPGNPLGRNIHFGVRENAMGGIMNGVAADGLTRIYGGTFFVFADFMRPSVRLAALMDLPVIYVWTHDSIGVGEDGPTHQPVEHLCAYRSIPNLAIVRPADAAETVEAWKATLEQRSPVGLVLTRQDVPNPARGLGTGLADASQLDKGAYILADTEATPDVILLASGSEVQFALEARTSLQEDGIAARVVSVPCMEWFEQQSEEYRDLVLPPEVTARVSIEAGPALPWLRYVGPTGKSISIDTYGASAAPTELFEHFGLNSAAVTQAARSLVLNQ